MKISTARLEDLPIPEDVQPTSLWSEQMLELADHIGPLRTLQLLDVLGGQKVIVPMDPARNRMREVIGEEGARIMSSVYGRNELYLPLAKPALCQARRAPIIAQIRRGELSIKQAVPMLRLSDRAISQLVNGAEGSDRQPPVRARKRRDGRQIELFSE